MKRKFFVPTLILTCVFGAAAFYPSGTESTSASEAEVWGTYNTLKVSRDVHTYEKESARLDVTMGLGESEGDQLVITPSGDIGFYKLQPGELKTAAGDVFSASGVSVFVQRYIYVSKKTYGQTNAAYEAGYIPDMLLPQETAIRYKENTVKAGQNQSVTVEFTTDSGTKPGIYTGTFQLIIDGTSRDIPVTVEVRNADVTKAYGASLFDLNASYLLAGEYDSTMEKYRTYYETLLNEYKTCAYYLPNSYKGTDAFISEILYYWDNPNFTSYNIPTFANVIQGSFNFDLLEQYLTEMCKYCTEDAILFDKAKMYIWSLDEPATEAKLQQVKDTTARIKEIERNVLERLSSEGFLDEESALYEKIEKSLTSVPIIITTSYTDAMAGSIDTYCPYVSDYDTQARRDVYNSEQVKTGGEKWFYTCMNPLYPYPSHHIDDYLLGPRMIRWMQYAYDVDGYLYYQTNNYCNISTGMPVDEYTDPVRFSQGAAEYPGDGYVFYPGIEYGSDTPFGSVRAVAIRDGQEDLNLLCQLDNIYAENGEVFGLEGLDASAIINVLQTQLFTGTKYKTEDGAFYDVRDTVFDLYEAAASDSGLTFAALETGNESAKVTLYAKVETLMVNGAERKGVKSDNGYQFDITVDFTENFNYLEVEYGGASPIRFLLSEKMWEAADFSESLDGLTVTEGSQMKLMDGKADLTIVSMGETLSEKLTFKPAFELSSGLFGGDLSSVKDIVLNIENRSSETLRVYVIAVNGNEERQLTEITIEQGIGELRIENIGGTAWDKLSTAEKIVFRFDNVDSDGNLRPDRMLSLYSVWYSREEN